MDWSGDARASALLTLDILLMLRLDSVNVLSRSACTAILLYSNNRSVDVVVCVFVSVSGEDEGRSLFLSLPSCSSAMPGKDGPINKNRLTD